jgi:geranyl-CoA carboxylase alpha subunit
MAFTTILVANRGEIAVRVMKSARRMGYRTAAIYSSADAGAQHVSAANVAVPVGPAPASESYLSIERILEAAQRSGADAIHPGYGFLSENAAFARACAAAGIVFIGPPPEAIELMGNKALAKRSMIEAGVPCVPGYEGEDQSDAAFRAAADRIGFPVMVKAAAGGGGRGMRLCAQASELGDALRAARSEAKNAFGSDELILEKALTRARHVELQVFADAHGHVVHLGERDCSVQRRHQKVIEESPAVDASLRERMGAAAVEAARACAYQGAGTVEFMLDGEGQFYFLEMNTRLQVEHPVTELVTGLDLVEWQIRVARGEPLPLRQVDIVLSGHAIEARLYAEDPAEGFLPQTGKIIGWRTPEGARIDTGVSHGSVVSPHYDPMIAKLIAHGDNREDARRKLHAALGDTILFGVASNKAFLMRILEDEVFCAGPPTTAFLSERLTTEVSAPDRSACAHAALIVFLEGAQGLCEDESFIGWRSGGPIWSTVKLALRAHETTMQLTALGRGETGRRYAVDDGAARIELEVVGQTPGELAVVCDGVRRTLRYALDGDRVWLDEGRGALSFDDVTHRPARAAQGAGSGLLRAPLDGAVTKLFVTRGDSVARGQLVLVLEAMKMEHRILSDVDGTVEALHVDAGVQVKTRQLLAEIRQPDEA